MTYKPVPGTTPFRVIELLHGYKELTTQQIAAELDIVANQLQAFMKTAIAHGAVVAEKREHLLHWRLGDGTPPQRREADHEEEPDDDPVIQRVVEVRPRAVVDDPLLRRSVPASPAPATPSPAVAPPVKPARKQARKPRAGHAEPGAAVMQVPAAWQGTLNDLGRVATEIAPPAPMRCAVWSDGAMSIERGGQRQNFSVEEARLLCNYLDVVRGGREQ